MKSVAEVKGLPGGNAWATCRPLPESFAANLPVKNGYGHDGSHSSAAMVRIICSGFHFIQIVNIKLLNIHGVSL